MFTGLPDKVNRSCILTDDDLKYLVEMYSKTGFRLGKLTFTHTIMYNLERILQFIQ